MTSIEEKSKMESIGAAASDMLSPRSICAAVKWAAALERNQEGILHDLSPNNVLANGEFSEFALKRESGIALGCVKARVESFLFSKEGQEATRDEIAAAQIACVVLQLCGVAIYLERPDESGAFQAQHVQKFADQASAELAAHGLQQIISDCLADSANVKDDQIIRTIQALISISSGNVTGPQKNGMILPAKDTVRTTVCKCGDARDLFDAVENRCILCCFRHVKQAGTRDGNRSNGTALMLAAETNFKEAVILLAQLEARAQDLKGRTALMLAAREGHVECVEILALFEAGLQKVDGTTALMLCAAEGHELCVLALLASESGLRNEYGECALSKAFKNSQEACVRALWASVEEIKAAGDETVQCVQNRYAL